MGQIEVIVDTDTSFGSVAVHTDTAGLGSSSGSNNVYQDSPSRFDGRIDDLRIYSEALDGDQIAALASCGEPGDDATDALLACWSLDGELDRNTVYAYGPGDAYTTQTGKTPKGSNARGLIVIRINTRKWRVRELLLV